MVAGYAGTQRAKAYKQAISWSHRKLETFGCYTEEGMEKLRRGGSPKITMGDHIGDTIELDHVLPRVIVPELAARFYNLEAVPAKVNGRKSARITEREITLARRWHREGLLSAAGLAAVERVTK
jgi:hypothetical protein